MKLQCTQRVNEDIATENGQDLYVRAVVTKQVYEDQR